jgi:dTDP-4-amino-4,6-dideoxygalactose transaminase
VGIHQLKKLEDFTERRARYAEIYNEELSGMEEIELPESTVNGRHAWHLYAIRLNLKSLTIDRAQFIANLQRKNIGASVHFIPIPFHPFFKKWADLPENQCPKALELYPRLISLPLYPAMTEEEVRYVARAVREIAGASRQEKATASVSSCNSERFPMISSDPQ